MKNFPVLAALAAALAAPAASAQSFNLAVGSAGSLPSNAYGAGAAQPGKWVAITSNPGAPTPVADVANLATGVTVARLGGNGDFGASNPAWSGDDEMLMEEGADLGSGSMTWTINGLAGGSYTIYTYALAPDFPALFTTRIDVTGAPQGPQIVGGNWLGSPHVLGQSYAKHTVTLSAGSPLTVLASTPAGAGNLGTVNGFQIVRTDSFTAYCAGDGSLATACPCGNAGATGRGCDNSLASGGAKLAATGSTGPDTVVFTSSFEPASALTIFLQGNVDAPAGLTFGDGVRCVAGNLKRIAVVNASGGVATYPGAGDPSISARSAALGDPIPSGATRFYQAYYRDANLGFCPAPAGDAWNVSNGLKVVWP